MALRSRYGSMDVEKLYEYDYMVNVKLGKTFLSEGWKGKEVCVREHAKQININSQLSV